MINKRNKVAVIGAGNVGATLGFILAQKNIADVVLLDIAEGVAEGKALDIAQTAPVLGFDISVHGGTEFSLLDNADVVVVTAGFPRKPGMDRIDLLKKNAQVLSSVAKHIKEFAPQSIVIAVTNPVDVMTYHLWKETGFASSKVLGQAGVLDSARYQLFLSRELQVSVNSISSILLGGHGDSMVPLPRYTTVAGIPLENLLESEKIGQIIERTKKGGAEIVSLLKTGSAYFAPAAATAAMVESILLDQHKVMVCSAYVEGQFGVSDLYIGVPVLLGKNGMEGICELSLNETEMQEFQQSAGVYKEAMQKLEELVYAK